MNPSMAPAPRVFHTSILPPAFTVRREEVMAHWARLAGPEQSVLIDEIDRLSRAAQVDQRQLVASVEELIAPRGAGVRNAEYQQHTLAYGEKALRQALAEAKLQPEDLDVLITLSCTGLMIPSLDAYLVNRIGLRRDILRLPLTELGCAAGAIALSRARDFILARPGIKVAILAVELPSLTFNIHNAELANLVSSVLFGDGVAVALLDGQAGPGLEILGTRSELYPNTEYLMGFSLSDEGLQVILDRDVPKTVKANIRRSITGFLESEHVAMEELRFLLLHPGGRKLIDHIETELGLAPEMTALSRSVLREHGNMSSATVLYVMDQFLKQQAGSTPSGSHGLMAAMGPGFCVEQLHVRWQAAAA